MEKKLKQRVNIKNDLSISINGTMFVLCAKNLTIFTEL